MKYSYSIYDIIILKYSFFHLIYIIFCKDINKFFFLIIINLNFVFDFIIIKLFYFNSFYNKIFIFMNSMN